MDLSKLVIFEKRVGIVLNYKGAISVIVGSFKWQKSASTSYNRICHAHRAARSAHIVDADDVRTAVNG